MQYRYSKYFPAIVYLGDLLVLNIAIQLSVTLYASAIHVDKAPLNFSFFFIANLSWVLISALTKTYDIKRPLVLSEDINKFLISLAYYLVIVFGTLYFLQVYDVARYVLFVHIIAFFILIVLQRSVLFFSLEYIRRNGFNQRNILLVGDYDVSQKIRNNFNNHPEYGYRYAGFVGNTDLLKLDDEEIFELIKSKNVHEVYLGYKNADSLLVSRLISICEENGVRFKVISDLILETGHAQLINYGELPVLRLRSFPRDLLKIRLLKRSFDLMFSSAVMVSGMPIFLVLVLLTKTTTRGPVFYKQQRIGRNGKPFYIYKFRSMYIDAEKFGPQLSKDNDPRVTKWGRIMRKTRLDELPQFMNVFVGHMSVVGPRPERQYFIEKIVEKAPQYTKLLSVKPGITSIGQVKYGYAENVDQMLERMRYDMLYLNRQKLKTDIGIILETVRVMVQGKGK